MTEQELMQSIKAQWGAEIADACKPSAVPPAFLAALVAGESGGKPDAKRFEPGVLRALWEVLLGRKTTYGSIRRADLVQFVAGLASPPVSSPQSLPADAFQRVDSLATSWGLTQIMGYHILDKTLMGPPPPPAAQDLQVVVFSLFHTITMLERFAKEFAIDERLEFDKLFRCWNTGQPDGKTFDPAYVTNGLARMAIWSSLA